MLYLSKQSIEATFLNIGYSKLDYLYLNQIQRALNQLNQEEFDKQTLQQLAGQCRNNSKGQVKLQDVVLTFVKAQNILVQREQQLKRVADKLLSDIKDQKNRIDGKGGAEIQKLQEEYEQVKQQQVENNINLQIIRKPFAGRRQAGSRYVKSTVYAAPYQQLPKDQQLIIPGEVEQTLLFANTQTFSWIFQLTLFLLFLQFPCILYLNNFMNILIFSMIILNFVTGYFCRTILRIWMYFLLVSILVDIVYFVVGARQMWIPTYKDWSNQISSYLRLVVVLYGVISVGKLILFILFLSEYNTDQTEKKTVSIFGFYQLYLSHDQITKNVFPMLNKTSNHSRFHSQHPEEDQN